MWCFNPDNKDKMNPNRDGSRWLDTEDCFHLDDLCKVKDPFQLLSVTAPCDLQLEPVVWGAIRMFLDRLRNLLPVEWVYHSLFYLPQAKPNSMLSSLYCFGKKSVCEACLAL